MDYIIKKKKKNCIHLYTTIFNNEIRDRKIEKNKVNKFPQICEILCFYLFNEIPELKT